MVAYYINSYLEVEAIKVGSDAWRELRNIGNLYDTWEQAGIVLHEIRQIIQKYHE